VKDVSVEEKPDDADEDSKGGGDGDGEKEGGPVS